MEILQLLFLVGSFTEILVERKKDSVAWICKCDCGKEIITTVSALNSGNTNSCGCTHKSEGEELVKNILLKENINFRAEEQVEGLTSKNNIPLRFDFYLIDYNCYIEFDGEQHYESNIKNSGWNTYQKYEYTY